MSAAPGAPSFQVSCARPLIAPYQATSSTRSPNASCRIRPPSGDRAARDVDHRGFVRFVRVEPCGRLLGFAQRLHDVRRDAFLERVEVAPVERPRAEQRLRDETQLDGLYARRRVHRGRPTGEPGRERGGALAEHGEPGPRVLAALGVVRGRGGQAGPAARHPGDLVARGTARPRHAQSSAGSPPTSACASNAG